MEREFRTRWTDDRLDDMAKSVERNSARQDSTQNMVAAHDLQLIEIDRDRRSRAEHGYAFVLSLVVVALTAVANIVATVLTSH